MGFTHTYYIDYEIDVKILLKGTPHLHEEHYGPQFNDIHVLHRITDRNHNFCILTVKPEIEYKLTLTLAPLSLPEDPKSDRKNVEGHVFGFGFTGNEFMENLQKTQPSTSRPETRMEQRKLTKMTFKFSDCQGLQTKYNQKATDPVRIQPGILRYTGTKIYNNNIWMQK